MMEKKESKMVPRDLSGLNMQMVMSLAKASKVMKTLKMVIFIRMLYIVHSADE